MNRIVTLRAVRRFTAALAVALALQAVPSWPAGFPVDAERDGIPTLAPLVAKVAPGVVTIMTFAPGGAVSGYVDEADEPWLVPLTGSGVIVDAARGFILTNAHVVADATWIGIALPDGRVFEASLVGADEATDVAVLAIPAEDLPQVPFGDSRSLQVGDLVIAIGDPFGIGQTVTWGIVSALGRGLTMEGYEDFIQTDAAINPGNSGGALIDMHGHLVGLSTAIIGPGANIGLGFAVPIDLARAVMEQLIEYGEMRRARIGLEVVDLSAQMVAELGVGGAMVFQVHGGSPAARAGLRPGDIVLGYNGAPVRDARDLLNRFALARLGDRAQLTVQRARGLREFELRLDEAATAARN